MPEDDKPKRAEWKWISILDSFKESKSYWYSAYQQLPPMKLEPARVAIDTETRSDLPDWALYGTLRQYHRTDEYGQLELDAWWRLVPREYEKLAETAVRESFDYFRGEKASPELIDAILVRIAYQLRARLSTRRIVSAAYGYEGAARLLLDQYNQEALLQSYAAYNQEALLQSYAAYNQEALLQSYAAYEPLAWLAEFEPTFSEIWQKVMKVAEALVNVWVESLDDSERRAALLDMKPSSDLVKLLVDSLAADSPDFVWLLEPYAEPKK